MWSIIAASDRPGSVRAEAESHASSGRRLRRPARRVAIRRPPTPVRDRHRPARDYLGPSQDRTAGRYRCRTGTRESAASGPSFCELRAAAASILSRATRTTRRLDDTPPDAPPDSGPSGCSIDERGPARIDPGRPLFSRRRPGRPAGRPGSIDGDQARARSVTSWPWSGVTNRPGPSPDWT